MSAKVLQFPTRSSSRCIAITAASGGFDVDLTPSRSDLVAWFTTYPEAEAYALGIARMTGLPIVDADADSRPA